MQKKPVLVVMAAGMGSRYGGLKQIDPVGSHGEAILDYSLFDAYEAGFETAVIIIKEAIRDEFMQTVGVRLQKSPMQIRYAFQELSMLPDGFQVPEGRVKPFGTGHAVLCAKAAIDGAPFAVINADDYYGKSAFCTIFNALSQSKPGPVADFCMVGYRLDMTVTDHGSVARGVCLVDADGCLAHIQERTHIEKQGSRICYTEDGQTWQTLAPDTVVSMNMWGFTPYILDALEAEFPKFLTWARENVPQKSEFLLPEVVDKLIHTGLATVKVLRSEDKWYGVTYAADKPLVQAAIGAMTRKGLYPDNLWK